MARRETREDFVRRVLAFEARAATTRDDRAEAAAALFEKTSRVLAPVIGIDAVDAIFKRSVRVTKRDFTCLELVAPPGQRVDPRSCLRACWGNEQRASFDAAIALYVRFFTSIDKLIGARLASRILEGAWPELPAIDDTSTKTEEEKKG